MTVEKCDICGMELNNILRENSTACRWNTYDEKRTKYADKVRVENCITLCERCNERMIAYITNHYDLRNDIDSMRLGNRIRFLLKLPFKAKKEVYHDTAR